MGRFISARAFFFGRLEMLNDIFAQSCDMEFNEHALWPFRFTVYV
jgi:hypothetical protein